MWGDRAQTLHMHVWWSRPCACVCAIRLFSYVFLPHPTQSQVSFGGPVQTDYSGLATPHWMLASRVLQFILLDMTLQNIPSSTPSENCKRKLIVKSLLRTELLFLLQPTAAEDILQFAPVCVHIGATNSHPKAKATVDTVPHSFHQAN